MARSLDVEENHATNPHFETFTIIIPKQCTSFRPVNKVQSYAIKAHSPWPLKLARRGADGHAPRAMRKLFRRNVNSVVPAASRVTLKVKSCYVRVYTLVMCYICTGA